MRKYKFPLHYRIFLGMILGTLFGIFFQIPNNSLDIIYIKNDIEVSNKIKEIDSLTINYRTTSVDSAISIKINKINRKSVIAKFKTISDDNDVSSISIICYCNSRSVTFRNVIEINSTETLATFTKPLGTIFIRLLLLLAIPLVLSTLIVGVASLDDIRTVGKLGIKTLIFYIGTTAIALTLGISLANIISPGTKILGNKEELIIDSDQFGINLTERIEFNITDFLVDAIPKNIFESLTDANMLQIVFFALFFGIALIFLDSGKSDIIVDFLNSLSEALIKMVDIVMIFAPFGVFALIAYTIADFGISIIQTLLWYIFTVLIGLTLHTLITYGGIIRFFSKFSVKEFFRKIRDAQTIAFSTSSSAATLPVTMETAEKDLKLPRKITSFVLPLGATINMDGTALLQGVAAIFIAQFYNIDLNITQQVTIVLMGILASIGTAPVPGVGIIMLIGILQSVGLPLEGIGIILGVDRILDMARTVTNITGDLTIATIMSKNYSASEDEEII